MTKKREMSIMVVRWGSELGWWRAALIPIYSAQARLITHGETVEILGYYPNITNEQRIRILDAYRRAEAEAEAEAEGRNPWTHYYTY